MIIVTLGLNTLWQLCETRLELYLVADKLKLSNV